MPSLVKTLLSCGICSNDDPGLLASSKQFALTSYAHVGRSARHNHSTAKRPVARWPARMLHLRFCQKNSPTQNLFNPAATGLPECLGRTDVRWWSTTLCNELLERERAAAVRPYVVFGPRRPGAVAPSVPSRFSHCNPSLTNAQRLDMRNNCVGFHDWPAGEVLASIQALRSRAQRATARLDNFENCCLSSTSPLGPVGQTKRLDFFSLL